MEKVPSGPPVSSKNTNEEQRFVETRESETAVRVVSVPGKRPEGSGDELPSNPFKPDPHTRAMFQALLCELSQIRMHLEVMTGEKFRGD